MKKTLRKLDSLLFDVLFSLLSLAIGVVMFFGLVALTIVICASADILGPELTLKVGVFFGLFGFIMSLAAMFYFIKPQILKRDGSDTTKY